jgi:hypothetical protein
MTMLEQRVITSCDQTRAPERRALAWMHRPRRPSLRVSKRPEGHRCLPLPMQAEEDVEPVKGGGARRRDPNEGDGP